MTEEMEEKIEDLSEERARFVLKSLLLTGRVSEGLMRNAIDLSNWIES